MRREVSETKKLQGILARLLANLEYILDVYGTTILEVIVIVILLEIVVFLPVLVRQLIIFVALN